MSQRLSYLVWSGIALVTMLNGVVAQAEHATYRVTSHSSFDGSSRTSRRYEAPATERTSVNDRKDSLSNLFAPGYGSGMGAWNGMGYGAGGYDPYNPYLYNPFAPISPYYGYGSGGMGNPYSTGVNPFTSGANMGGNPFYANNNNNMYSPMYSAYPNLFAQDPYAFGAGVGGGMYNPYLGQSGGMPMNAGYPGAYSAYPNLFAQDPYAFGGGVGGGNPFMNGGVNPFTSGGIGMNNNNAYMNDPYNPYLF